MIMKELKLLIKIKCVISIRKILCVYILPLFEVLYILRWFKE